ncbi:Fe3+/spermidine/putrescine ABC transporter ATP-binding protein [Candidatus Riesia sp. GBBU]|nr:Fe3+/spermidine/putrescine ABC transporter ATP-binding protein [Candidatus Riesia sp. GBBU]
MNKESISPLIKLSSLTKSFNGKNIIHNFNLVVENNQFVTVMGPSGCGKTTILRLIAGLEFADSGKILLHGKDITMIPAENRNINTVFQNYALFPHMSVFENIAFGLKMKRISFEEIKKKVKKILYMMQISKFSRRYPHQLSSGEQQRVAIARAIINEPKMLLLDESLSALDFHLRKEMQNELKTLQRKLGITFIYVTHDQEEALSMSDKILVMKNGSVEQYGSPKEIYEKPKNLFVAKFIGEINVLEAIVLHRINERYIKILVEEHECVFYTNINVLNGQKIKILLRPEDLKIEEINDKDNPNGIVGQILKKNYKGMLLDTEVKTKKGKKIKISEFFNKNDSHIYYTLSKKISVTWKKDLEIKFLI